MEMMVQKVAESLSTPCWKSTYGVKMMGYQYHQTIANLLNWRSLLHSKSRRGRRLLSDLPVVLVVVAMMVREGVNNKYAVCELVDILLRSTYGWQCTSTKVTYVG